MSFFLSVRITASRGFRTGVKPMDKIKRNIHFNIGQVFKTLDALKNGTLDPTEAYARIRYIRRHNSMLKTRLAHVSLSRT
jgi:hypothetical protein